MANVSDDAAMQAGAVQSTLRNEWQALILRARLGGIAGSSKSRGKVTGAAFKAVALAWASFADESGNGIQPGIATVAVLAEVCFRTAKDVTAALVVLGLLVKVRETTRQPGCHDEYRLALPDGLRERVTLLSDESLAAESEAMRASLVRPSRGRERRPRAQFHKIASPRPEPSPVPDSPESPDGPTALYRWWDEAAVLLYVGITDNLSSRQTAHARRSSWGEFAASSTVERFASRAEAAAAEVLAIRAERPLFNGTHNDTPEARERLVRYLVEHDRLDLLTPAVSRG